MSRRVRGHARGVSGDRIRSPLKETLTISGYTTKPLLIHINNYLAKSSVVITYSYGVGIAEGLL